MRLQVALDCKDAETALSIAGMVAQYVDIIEAGTPLIKIEGIGIVSRLKKAHPDKIILADLKTMDVGRFEADFAIAAGADIVTVCGAAADGTIKGAIAGAKAAGKECMVDLINVADKPGRAKQAASWGADYVGVHSGIDQQNEGLRPLDDLVAVRKATDIRVIVAGGIDTETIRDIAIAGPDVVVVGGAITSAEDQTIAARALKEAIELRFMM